MMGRLTAVVVNKNEAKGLELTINSLRNQETPVEIVVVDGGSTDGSWEIATSMADKAVRGYGLGMGLDRVIGIKQASGDFIISCDSDAIYPQHYSTLAKELLTKYCAWTGPIYPKDSKDWKRLAELESLGSHFVSIAPFCYEHNLIFKKSVFLNLGLDKLPYLSRFDIGVPVKIFMRPDYEPRLYCYSRLPTYLFKRLFWGAEIL
jgi:glycosyltransferase involved in cell wall biosynthesis